MTYREMNQFIKEFTLLESKPMPHFKFKKPTLLSPEIG